MVVNDLPHMLLAMIDALLALSKALKFYLVDNKK